MEYFQNTRSDQRVFGRDITNLQQNSRGISIDIPSNNQIKKGNNQIEKINDLQKIALEDKHNPQLVSCYQQQIFEYLRNEESKYKINNYMSDNDEINEDMRQILIDWLVDVQRKFKLVPETLFLTVYIIDKYLESNKIKRTDLQLLGVAASFIAAKYEVIYPPQIRDFVEVTDRTYNKQQILDMESSIIRSLGFNFTKASSLRFFERYVRLISEDKRVYNLGLYLLELSLVDYKFIKYLPSNLAASALYLCLKIFKKQEVWNQNLEDHTKYSEQDLRVCGKDMFLMLQSITNSKQLAVRRKFASSQYLEISNIQILRIQ